MDALSARFADAVEWFDDSSPLYAHLCRRVADDPAVLELADEVPDARSPPHVLLAAVQYRLAERTHRLREYYPSLVDDPRDPDDECYPAFREFCLAEADALRPLLRTRGTQTNAVGRCTVLYPSIARVERAVDGPLALVELGPSAGLNLCFDRYRYDYDGRVVGDPDAPITLESSVRSGSPPLPETPPEIHSRVGVDLNPLDVTDDEDADWLRALIWPEHERRRERLDGALTIARDDPLRLVEGDLLEDLPAILDEIPDDVPVCVFNTLVLYQVPDAICDELDELLTDRMTDRPLHWLSGETELSGGESVRLDWTRAVDGSVETTHLVDYDPHGAWLDWQA